MRKWCINKITQSKILSSALWVQSLCHHLRHSNINLTWWGRREQGGLQYHGTAHSAWTAPLQSCETSCTEDRWSPEHRNTPSHQACHINPSDSINSAALLEKGASCQFILKKQSVHVTSDVWSWLRSVLGCSGSVFWEPPFPGVWTGENRAD